MIGTGDAKTKVDAADQGTGYLDDKLTVTASDLVKSIGSPGSTETLHIELATTGVAAGDYGNGASYPIGSLDDRGRWTAAGVVNIVDNETLAGAINSSNTAYTLAHTPVTGSLQVYLGATPTSLNRLAETAFSVTGAALTMGAAPTTGSILRVSYRY